MSATVPVLRTVATRHRESLREVEELRLARNDLIRALLADGHTTDELAEVCQLSQPRIVQIGKGGA